MIDIVLQGAINDYAIEVAEHYSELPFVNKIILSGWEGDKDYNSSKIIAIKNKPIWPGVGNRNLQIRSSFEGLKLTNLCGAAMKMRNDQKVSLESMELMHDYFNMNKETGLIFVAGIFPTFPFHPRDHIFCGFTYDLLDLFNIPYDVESLSDDYTRYMRSEAYIGMLYCARHSVTAEYMTQNKELFLLDNSPRRKEAIELSESLKLFRPFPRINFEWPKYGMKEYHYDYTKQLYGEYQG